MIDYEALIARVIKREGGDLYTNRAADAGGPTKYGITLATLYDWRKAPVSAEDVRQLTEMEAVRIYRTKFFPTCYTLIPEPTIVEELFDFGVNSGIGNSVRALQRCLKVTDDGAFGPMSTAALGRVTNWPALFWRLKYERLELMLRFIGARHDQAENAIGWANRVDQLEMDLQ